MRIMTSGRDNKWTPCPQDADPLIALLCKLGHDPNASREFDLMSGGFVWSDEKHGTEVAFGSPTQSLFRCLLGYRASLIRAMPIDHLRWLWVAVERGCPNWPGLRPERIDPSLAKELGAENARALRRLEVMDRLCARHAKNSKSTSG
jgi:hypothetical protein